MTTTYIGNQPHKSSVRYLDYGTFTEDSNTITIDQGYEAENIEVVVGGVVLDQTEYTATDGVTITLGQTYPSGTHWRVDEYHNLDTLEADRLLDRSNHTGTQSASTISDPENFTLTKTDGSTSRTLSSLISEGITVKDFSGAGDGVTDDTQALLDMGASLGWIVLSRGSYRVTSTNIDYPIYFQPGAHILVETGESVVIRNRIHSSVQYIFQGDGEYLINVESGGETGEDARVIHAGWFGVFPSNLASIDVTTRLQRCLNSFSGQTREGIVDTGQGSFHISGPITVPRGTWLRGAGTRRTIFDVTGDGYTVFTTEDDACRFSDFQFEYPSGTTTSRGSAFIRLSHNNCETRDIWLWSSRFGIIVEGNGCSLKGTEATYGLPITAGGAMILVRGSNCMIDGVRQTTSSTGPTAIVDIGAGAASPVSNVTIRNIQTVCPSIPVLIRATTVDVGTISVDGVNCKSGSGSIESIVKILAQGSYSLSGINVYNILSGGGTEAIISISNTGTGSVRSVSIDGVNSSVAEGVGIKVAQTNGPISDIHFGSACSISHMDTPFDISGSVTQFKIPSGLTPNTYSASCYSFTISNLSAVEIPLNRTIYSGSAIITGASNQTAVLFVRVAPNPNVEIISGGTNITPHDYVLTGADGNTGTLNVGVSETSIYIENQSGSSIPVSFSLFAG